MNQEEWIGQTIVLDTRSPYTYIGILQSMDDQQYYLTDAALFDSREARIPQEVYLAECAAHGVAASRARIWVKQEHVISISLLSDIMLPA